MRVLVTGADGFAGRHLCRYLTSIGDSVVACAGPGGAGALDVTDARAVNERVAQAQPEGIINLAGISSVARSHSEPNATFLVNALGTLNVLQAARERVPKARLLLIGSGEMYGRIPHGHRASESDLRQPLSPYASSKCAAEDIGGQYSASYGIHVVFARPFNHLGAGQAPQFVLPSFARQIVEVTRRERPPEIEVGDLSPVRDFLHVDDVVRGYRLLLERAESGMPYNLCSGAPLSIRELLELLQEIAGVRLNVRIGAARLRPIEIPWLVGDPSRVRSVGWQPERTVREAITEVLKEAEGL